MKVAGIRKDPDLGVSPKPPAQGLMVKSVPSDLTLMLFAIAKKLPKTTVAVFSKDTATIISIAFSFER